ncbi:MAG TPA: hydantoinase/oxoprolinase family protein, partial [Gemmataceae bacterium]|nr:hydantoinase/oxoprolinase family protein [Gemmataceae bacterium]
MLGLDIGGANLKAATSAGASRSVPFPLWKRPDDLAAALEYLLGDFPEERELAVTMTGELCDCYASKSEGVQAILAAVAKAANRRGLREPRVWTTAGRFVTLDAALAEPLPAAAANWLALATYAGRLVPVGPALLIDIGSTTTDIIAIKDGQPTPSSRTDQGRLSSQELVYCGVRRTPLCALFGIGRAAEFFATTEDAYVVLGDLPEAPHRTDSADGRPMTRAHALARLARIECADVGDGSLGRRIAAEVRDMQVLRTALAVKHLAGNLSHGERTILGAGSGRFLIPRFLKQAGIEDLPLVYVEDSGSGSEAAYAV